MASPSRTGTQTLPTNRSDAMKFVSEGRLFVNVSLYRGLFPMSDQQPAPAVYEPMSRRETEAFIDDVMNLRVAQKDRDKYNVVAAKAQAMAFETMVDSRLRSLRPSQPATLLPQDLVRARKLAEVAAEAPAGDGPDMGEDEPRQV